jgi:flagellar hook assembly protein FlgD
VDVSIYNTLGQKIKTLFSSEQNAGLHSLKWDGTNTLGAVQSSGIYFYKISAGNNAAIRKMILMK